MEFLYFLEKIRSSLLNEIMLLITQLGEETAFLVVALVIFWCVDKRKGYFILAVGFIGTILNQFLKLWYRVPRPCVIYECFTIVEKAKTAASGYSFPCRPESCPYCACIRRKCRAWEDRSPGIPGPPRGWHTCGIPYRKRSHIPAASGGCWARL